jgi:hypothetical protein
VDNNKEVWREEVSSEGGRNTGKSVNTCAKWGGTSTLILLIHCYSLGLTQEPFTRFLATNCVCAYDMSLSPWQEYNLM